MLIDAGASAREIVARLCAIDVDPHRLDGILISHAHSDHYRSAGTLHARFGIPVYVDPSTARALRWKGMGSSWRRIQETAPIPDRIGDLEILPLDTSHGDPESDGRTVAFHLKNGTRQVAVVTDLGTISDAILEALRGIDALILEANYDEEILERKLSDRRFARDWDYLEWVRSDRGHLSNRQFVEALAAILDSSACHVFPGHVSENHPDSARDNNASERAIEELTRAFRRRGLSLPHIHRTHRIGRDPSWISDLVELM